MNKNIGEKGITYVHDENNPYYIGYISAQWDFILDDVGVIDLNVAVETIKNRLNSLVS